MGRPSVKGERTTEILDAVQDCVLEFGLAGTTMARIAARAGLQPSAVHHFVGSRNQVIEAALLRSTAYYEQLLDDLDGQPAEDVLDVLIGQDRGSRSIPGDVMVLFDELLTLAPHDRAVRSSVRHVMEHLRWVLDRALARSYPDAATADREAVALALTLLVDNLERHVVVETFPEAARDDARRAADALVASLAS